ncbi:MAG: hypothetical protein PHQ98_01790 [Candidatus ainarchaeum sp.]|nr:hypothetical protein [Candidatus ainarchaeum sp.]
MEFYLKEIFEPENLINSVKNEGILAGLKNYLLVPMVGVILMALLTIIGSIFTGNIVAGVISAVVMVLLVAIVGSIAIIVGNFVFFIGAKLAGSKVSFSEQVYKLSVIALPIMVYLAIFLVVVIIGMVVLGLITTVLPVLSAIISLIMMVVVLLVLYPLAIAFMMFIYYIEWAVLKTIYSFDNKQLIKSVAISMAIVLLVISIVMTIFVGLFLMVAGPVMSSILPVM